VHTAAHGPPRTYKRGFEGDSGRRRRRLRGRVRDPSSLRSATMMIPLFDASKDARTGPERAQSRWSR
jgi:hypothetical protein